MTVLDKLYCYDSMYDDTITITGEPVSISSNVTGLSSVFITNSTNTLNHTGSGNLTIGTNTSGLTFANSGTISNGIGSYPYTTDTITLGDIFQRNGLNVRGDADVEGKLRVGGVDIGEALEKIEQRLGILRPNPELEARWERLRELGEEYRQLERDILGQEEIYNILKK